MLFLSLAFIYSSLNVDSLMTTNRHTLDHIDTHSILSTRTQLSTHSAIACGTTIDCTQNVQTQTGDLPVEDVPQIVLLTFDDSVNDLNKQLYSDLFGKGRVNPNGCPISATFYVSHEWTDYSQVQNLYADGHEMASHTVS